MPESLQNNSYDQDKYTIICTYISYGQMINVCPKDDVKRQCEVLRRTHSIESKSHMQIEVVNNNTGEIREYWNSEKNKIQF